MLIHLLGDKVNFVDKHNRLVGWDTGQSCCERAVWWISSTKDRIEPDAKELNQYSGDLIAFEFDPDWVERKRTPDEDAANDVDAHIAFRMVNDKGDALYLHLANSHNGYYGHGFNVDIGGKTVWGGVL